MPNGETRKKTKKKTTNKTTNKAVLLLEESNYILRRNLLQICLLFFLYLTRSQYYILRKIHFWRKDSATTVQFKQPLHTGILPG